MLDKKIYNEYLQILNEELIPALGCTEPIAVAYAAAQAVKALGCLPERMEIWCSGNIIKNVKGVVVPNTLGLKGINAAAIAGMLSKTPDAGLRVLEGLSPDDAKNIPDYNEKQFCVTKLATDVDNLFIEARVYCSTESAQVTIEKDHTNITKIVKNGKTVYQKINSEEEQEDSSLPDKSLLTIEQIIEFADTLNPEDIKEIIGKQIKYNTAISEEGLWHPYGVNVGQTLLQCYGYDVKNRAVAMTAAGSDARMSGCPLPVVINSGSGNQGLTASLPVVEYAKELKVPEDKLYRALVVSNLTAIHIKTSIGRLSAFCGAVTAACGSGAAITYLCGGDYDDISRTITNTLANVSGIVCDGAKASCAAKIASAVSAAILAHHLSFDCKAFAGGDGLIKGDIEATIRSVGRMGRDGMKGTDEEILRIMISE